MRCVDHNKCLGRRLSARRKAEASALGPHTLATYSLVPYCVPQHHAGQGAPVLSLEAAEALMAGLWFLFPGCALTAGRWFHHSTCTWGGHWGAAMCRPRPRGLSPPFPGADVVRDGCGRICVQGTSGASGSRRKDSLGCVKFNLLELLASRGARGAARHGGGRGQRLHMSGERGGGGPAQHGPFLFLRAARASGQGAGCRGSSNHALAGGFRGLGLGKSWQAFGSF